MSTLAKSSPVSSLFLANVARNVLTSSSLAEAEKAAVGELERILGRQIPFDERQVLTQLLDPWRKSDLIRTRRAAEQYLGSIAQQLSTTPDRWRAGVRDQLLDQLRREPLQREDPLRKDPFERLAPAHRMTPGYLQTIAEGMSGNPNLATKEGFVARLNQLTSEERIWLRRDPAGQLMGAQVREMLRTERVPLTEHDIGVLTETHRRAQSMIPGDQAGLEKLFAQATQHEKALIAALVKRAAPELHDAMLEKTRHIPRYIHERAKMIDTVLTTGTPSPEAILAFLEPRPAAEPARRRS